MKWKSILAFTKRVNTVSCIAGTSLAVAAAACLLGNDAVRCGKRQTLAPVPKPTLGVVAYNGTAKAFTQSQVGKQDKSRRIEGV